MALKYRLLEPTGKKGGKVKRKRTYRRIRKQVPGTPPVVGEGTPGPWTTETTTGTKETVGADGKKRRVKVRKVKRVRTIR